MSESKESAKAAKAAAKLAKKEAKAKLKQAQQVDPTTAPAPSRTPDAAADMRSDKPQSPTPAERSAAAAERQVRLQRWRIGIAIITAVLALGTLGFTLWVNRDKSDPELPTKPAATQPDSP